MKDLDLQPTLVGATVTLRPLATDDFDVLSTAASDPGIWEQHPDRMRYKRDVFDRNFFSTAVESRGALVVIENDSGRVIGSSRFYEWDPAEGEVAIGYTFIERGFWGRGTNAEMKALMLGHAFTAARVVWFHVGETNYRSRNAVEKLGAELAHRETRDLDGGKFTQLYYRLDPHMWSGASVDD